MTTSNTDRILMTPLARRTRAYFSPVDRATSRPSIFDPGKHGAFPLDSPPLGWIDLGCLENLRRTPGTRLNPVRGGPSGAPVALFRSQADARVEFDFRDWGKLQMALAGGSQHMNVLAPQAEAAAVPSGGLAITAAPITNGSTATEILLDSAALNSFAVGDLIVVDLDYQQQTGYVGTGVAAAYVRDPADVQGDSDYIRRVSFNVARVQQKTANSLLLAQPLIGGTPSPGAAVQKVVAFVDREAGSFFQEWSALFVVENESGGRINFYYPRLQPASGTQETPLQVVAPVEAFALHASFTALPYRDANDGEEILCYRSYFPASSAALY
ncbi:MAG: hypothetical protein ACE14M_00280 [Terriglobales bacterium]